MEDMFAQFMQSQQVFMQGQQSSMRNLENQIGQLANAISNRPHGSLPSDTENLRRDGKEHCNAITTRRSKQLPEVITPTPNETDHGDDKVEDSDTIQMQTDREAIVQPTITVPYPQQLKREMRISVLLNFLIFLRNFI